MSQAECRYAVKVSPDHILMCDWSFVAPGQATHPWCPYCCFNDLTKHMSCQNQGGRARTHTHTQTHTDTHRHTQTHTDTHTHTHALTNLLGATQEGKIVIDVYRYLTPSIHLPGLSTYGSGNRERAREAERERERERERRRASRRASDGAKWRWRESERERGNRHGISIRTARAG